MSNNNKLVKDVMSRHPTAVALGTDLTEVVEILLRQRTTGLPVVDAEGKVVGFISEQDCLRSLLVSSYHHEGAVRVEDVMFNSPLTVKPDDSVVEAAELMVRQKPKIYPVIDNAGQLVGVLHRGQVLEVLKNSRRELA